jgi:hypothetical protein
MWQVYIVSYIVMWPQLLVSRLALLANMPKKSSTANQYSALDIEHASDADDSDFSDDVAEWF